MYDEMKRQHLFAKFEGIVIDDAQIKDEQKSNIAGDDVRHFENICQIQPTTGDRNHEV